MSIRALNWAMSSRTGSPSRKAVLVVLADKADEHDSCFPSVSTIAYETELSERSVRDQLAQLRKLGFITSEQRFNRRGTQTSTRYVLLVEGQRDAPGNSNATTGELVEFHDFGTRQNLPGTDSAVENPSAETPETVEFREFGTRQNLPGTVRELQGEGAALAGGGCESCTPTTLNPHVNPQENPQSSSNDIPATVEPPTSSEAPAAPADDDEGSLSRFVVTPALANLLREVHPRLDAELLARRLARRVRVNTIDLERAAVEIVAASTRAIGDPVAYVASSIEKEPGRWVRPELLLPGNPSTPVVVHRTDAQERADVRSARARGLVDKGWPESLPLDPDARAALDAARAADRTHSYDTTDRKDVHA